jgi:hypothetical protein
MGQIMHTRILVGYQPLGKHTLSMSKRRCEDNSKKYLREINSKAVRCMELAKDSVQEQALVLAMLNHLVDTKMLLNCWRYVVLNEKCKTYYKHRVISAQTFYVNKRLKTFKTVESHSKFTSITEQNTE